MICMRGGFVIQRHNKLRDLEAELLNMVCKDVVTEPVLQDVEREQAQDARLDIHVVFGSPSDQPFLMSGFITRMLNPIGTSSRSNILSTREREKASILKQSAR